MRRPDDHRTALDGFITMLAHRTSTHPFFAGRLQTDPADDAYVPWLILPALELERRGDRSAPFRRRLWEAAIARCERGFHIDWHLPAQWWILERYRTTAHLRRIDRERIARAIIDARYWHLKPGEDHDGCFTETHQILHHVNRYLAGSRWPEAVFAVDGECGRTNAARAEARIRTWLGWRMRFGFSEWKSLAYTDANLVALLTLREFTTDADLRIKTDMVIDTILLQYALFHFDGDLACSQGRSGWRATIRGDEQMPSATCSLLFGRGCHTAITSGASVLLACGSYDVPPVIRAIGRERPLAMAISERESLDVDEAPGYGVDPSAEDPLLPFWGRLLDDRAAQANASPAGPDASGTTRADQYLYKTPHWQLSCVRDFRKGRRGFSQHIWQASLGDKASVFVTHPLGSGLEGRLPNRWSANNQLPRAAAHRNVLISIHVIDPAIVDDRLPLWDSTHAWFPCFAFDEVVERGPWVCGRKGDGYVALRCSHPTTWCDPDPAVIEQVHRFDAVARERAMDSRYELLARGHSQIWICELGDVEGSGCFEAFVAAIAAADFSGDHNACRYRSPSLGEFTFGWEKPLTVAGERIDLHPDARLTSPFGGSAFGSGRYEIAHAGHRLLLDHATCEREVI